jgi:hypothetical protein
LFLRSLFLELEPELALVLVLVHVQVQKKVQFLLTDWNVGNFMLLHLQYLL